MRGTIGFSPEYLVIGTTDHKGEVRSLNWEDTRIRTLNLSRFKTIILNFNSIELNLDKHSSTVNVFTKNGSQMKNMGFVDENVILNLVYLNNYLSSLRSKISLFYIYTPSNSFAKILFTKQIIVDKEWTELHNISISTIFPQQLDNFNLVDIEFDYFNNSIFMTKSEENISMINASEIIEDFFEEFDNFQFVFETNKRITPLCHTFDNSILSFLVNIGDLDVIILPHPPRVIPFDTTEVVLRKILGIIDESNVSYPKWISDLNTRRQNKILSEITELKEQMSFLEQQIKELEQQFSIHQKLQQILFVNGKLFVESSYQIISSMGFDPYFVEEKGRHHLEIELDDIVIVFMVLTNETPELKRKPLRILNQWVEDKEEQIGFSKKIKGVLLVNYLRQVDPRKRTSLEMDETTEKYALKRNFTIIDTSQLYSAYFNIVETKIMMKEDFISKLVNNNGTISDNGLDIKVIF